MDKILRNVTIFAVVILVLAAISMAVVLSEKFDSKNGVQNDEIDTTNTYVGDAQQVTLTVSGGKYILTPSTLQKDVPVRMTADMNTIFGCARVVVIKDFGVNKYLTKEDNIIEFTPTKTGTINIACSMNMYRGTFTVI